MTNRENPATPSPWPGSTSGFTDPNGNDVFMNCVNCGVYLYTKEYSPWASPIFCSMSYLTDYHLNDREYGYMVYPGWKVIAYKGDNYTSNVKTYDNTDGPTLMFYSTVYSGGGSHSEDDSLKIFFRGNEIRIPFFSDYPPSS
jgi:hypothetical protein